MDDLLIGGGVVRRDGGSARIGEDELTELKNVTDQIARDVSDYVQTDRENAHDTRFCEWGGQSSDGRKHKEDTGEDAKPFEGASDSRIYLSDKVVNEHVEEYELAACGSEPQIRGMEGSDAGRAQKVRTVLRYLVRTKWDDFRRQVGLVGNYMEGDEPGVGLAKVCWLREEALENALIEPADLVVIYVQRAVQNGMELAEEDIDYLLGLFEDEANEDELRELVRFIHPEMPESRVKKVVRELYDAGEAEFPRPYVEKNMPVFEAKRLWDDVFMPMNTTDVQRARVILERNWYSRPEVLKQARIEGWSDGFVKQLIGKGVDEPGFMAMTAFDDKYVDLGPEVLDPEAQLRGRYGGMYEVITAYTKDVNSDGVPGVYVRKFSQFCDVAAKDRELLGYKHGKYPFVVFPREYVCKRVLDSRGVTQITKTPQASVKLHNDSLEDHVQVATNPPWKTPDNPRFQLTLEPFGQIPASRRDDIGPLDMPQYPKAAADQRDWIVKEVDDYFGRENEEVSPEKTARKRQVRVDRFLDCLKSGLTMAVQLCQQYWEPEDLKRIVGGNGLPVARSVEEIQGEFDWYLSYDARDMDLEYLKAKGEFYMTYIRALDTRATVDWSGIVRRLMEGIDPIMAEMNVQEPREADERERREEKQNIAMMLNGVRPERPEQGQNHGLRLQVLQEEMDARMQNPDAFEPMSPAARQILKEQIQYRRFQVQQQENAEIGRRGYEEENLAMLGAGEG